MWRALIGYVAVIAIVFWSALIPSDGMLIFGDDIHHWYYFYRQAMVSWMSTGVVPFWNPYNFSGAPFLANPQVAVLYPVSWVYLFLPLPVAFPVYIAVHVLWAMAGMFWLLRNQKKTENCKQNIDISAWIGGLVFGLSGFFMARTWAGHVDVIAAAAWMPWTVWGFGRVMSSQFTVNSRKLKRADIANKNFDRSSEASLRFSRREGNRFEERLNFVRSPRAVAFASIALAFQLLAGYQTMAFLTLEAVGVLVTVSCIRNRSLRPLVPVALAVLGGLGLAAVQILPVQEFFRMSIRTYEFPYAWHSYGSLTWQSLIQFLNPFYFGNQHTYAGPPPNLPEHAAFVGLSGLGLAGLGMVIGTKRMVSEWRKRIQTNSEYAVIFLSFVVIALFGIWVSLGPNAPVDAQYWLWRLVPMYRYLRIPPRHLILVVFGLAGLAGLGAGEILKKSNFQFPISKRIPIIRNFRINAPVALVFIVSVEMILFARQFVEMRPVPEKRQDPALIALLTSDREPYRVLQNFGVWLPQRDAFDFDAATAHDIFSATGYDPSILKPYYEFIARATGREGKEAVLSHDVQIPYLSAAQADTLDFLNIKYLLVPALYDPFAANSRYKKIYTDATGQLVGYENTTVLPRFYSADRTCGDVRVVSYTPNRIELSVDSTCDTDLVSSEVWYPGWTAAVDGKLVPVGTYRDTFRSVSVPAGKHEVTYAYRPTIFLLGAAVSLLTAGALLWVSRKKLESDPTMG